MPKPFTHQRIALTLAGLAGLTLGACFNGLEAQGLPCTSDVHCGPQLSCIDGFCGGSDDTGAALGPNQCEQPEQSDLPFVWYDGPEETGVEDPFGVLIADYDNNGVDDILFAANNGTFVRVLAFGDGPPVTIDLEGSSNQSPYYGDQRVADIEIADLDGDGLEDIVVVTDQDGIGVYVYRSGAGGPSLWGSFITLPLAFDVRGIELGQFDDDSNLDLAIIADGPMANGHILVGTGNPSAAAGGGNYFSPELSLMEIGYTEFFDSDVLGGNSTDSLLVSGRNGNMPALWRLQRQQDMLMIWDWAEAVSVPAGLPGHELAVGRIDSDDLDDVVLLDNSGQLQAFLGMPDGVAPAEATIDATVGLGSGLNGLVLTNINCDGLSDMVFNSAAPPSIQIVLGDGSGDILTGEVISHTTSPGGQGPVGVVEFDNEDESYDLIHALGGTEAEIKVYTSTEFAAMP